MNWNNSCSKCPLNAEHLLWAKWKPQHSETEFDPVQSLRAQNTEYIIMCFAFDGIDQWRTWIRREMDNRCHWNHGEKTMHKYTNQKFQWGKRLKIKIHFILDIKSWFESCAESRIFHQRKEKTEIICLSLFKINLIEHSFFVTFV